MIGVEVVEQPIQMMIEEVRQVVRVLLVVKDRLEREEVLAKAMMTCEDQCDDLFRGRDVDVCIEDMTVNEVQGMFNAFDEDKGELEDPDEEDDLKHVHPDDIRNALDIDKRIWIIILIVTAILKPMLSCLGLLQMNVSMRL